MSYKVATIANFRSEAKRLLKKYPFLQKELNDFREQLSIQPTIGTSIGYGCYKIRLAIASKGKGNPAAPELSPMYVADTTAFLLSIYDKSSRSSISDNELKELLKLIP